jgi:hypothetical protein
MMRKKIKIDPFGGGKKTRKNQVNGLFTPQPTPTSSQTQISQDTRNGSDKMEIDHVGQGAPPASPVQLTTSPRKKKRKKMLNPDSGAANLFTTSPTPGRDSASQDHTMASLSGDDVVLQSASVRLEPPRTPVKDPSLCMVNIFLRFSLAHCSTQQMDWRLLRLPKRHLHLFICAHPTICPQRQSCHY